jgi:hypothetical protein
MLLCLKGCFLDEETQVQAATRTQGFTQEP